MAYTERELLDELAQRRTRGTLVDAEWYRQAQAGLKPALPEPVTELEAIADRPEPTPSSTSAASQRSAEPTSTHPPATPCDSCGLPVRARGRFRHRDCSPPRPPALAMVKQLVEQLASRAAGRS